MSRKSARETAMKLLYEYSITGALSKDSLHDAPDVLDFEQLDEENLHYIDQVIDGFRKAGGNRRDNITEFTRMEN